jgi:hypothetical protein
MNSVPLYILIIACTGIFAFLADRAMRYSPALANGQNSRERTPIKARLWLVSAFFCAWFFLAFRNTGQDLESYKTLFAESVSIKYVFSQGFDTGYFLFNYIVRIFTNQYVVFSMIVSFVTLFLVFKAFWNLRNNMSFGFLVLGYMALSYLQSFNLIRIYLTQAVIIFSINYLFKKKYLKFVIGVIIASLFHNSAVVCFIFIVPFLFKKSFYIVVYVMFFALLGFLLYPQIILQFVIFKRYLDYFADLSALIIGYVEPVKIIAFLIPFIYCAVNNGADKQFVRFIVFATGIYLMLVLIGFRISVFGRLAIYFFPIFGYAMAFVLKRQEIDVAPSKPERLGLLNKTRFSKITYSAMGLYFVLFLSVWLYLYLDRWLVLDGITDYFFVWSKGL